MLCNTFTSNFTNSFLEDAQRITKQAFQECKRFLTGESECIGIIQSVTPIDPENQSTTCFHKITLQDGSEFYLIFPEMEFQTLEPRLKEGYPVKITYHSASDGINTEEKYIRNIYPRPYYKIMPFGEFVDREDVNDQTPVQIQYLENRVIRIDIKTLQQSNS